MQALKKTRPGSPNSIAWSWTITCARTGSRANICSSERDSRLTITWLTSRAETDAFKEKHGVKTTPQTFIDGERIGGHDDLRRYFGLSVSDKDATSYVPVIAIFATALLMALSLSWAMFGTLLTVRFPELFVATAMCILGIQKLQDVEQFSTMFLNYDLLARRWVPYGYVYPFGETLAGVLMLSGALMWLAAPVALFIGTVGAISVFKAVYIDRREIKCACVGGNSKVPLGFVSLTENLIMIRDGNLDAQYGCSYWAGKQSAFLYPVAIVVLLVDFLDGRPGDPVGHFLTIGIAASIFRVLVVIPGRVVGLAIDSLSMIRQIVGDLLREIRIALVGHTFDSLKGVSDQYSQGYFFMPPECRRSGRMKQQGRWMFRLESE